MRKKTFRLAAALLAFCIAASLFPPVGLADGYPDLRDLVVAAADGVVDLGGQTIRVNDLDAGGSRDCPYVISAPVKEIRNGTLLVWASGFVLDTDVKLSNVRLQFATTTGNFIAANGHSLTLENVRCINQSGDHSFNLYGGGMTGIYSQFENFSLPSPGPAGRIVIEGNVSLQGSSGEGNIYAGNLFRTSDGADPQKVFSGNVDIIINGTPETGALGTVYACGAEQNGITAVEDPTYAVSGGVTVSGAVPDVAGMDGTRTDVLYRGGGNQAKRTFTGVSSLSVESGNLVLNLGSWLQNGGSLSLASGAKLDLQNINEQPLGVHDFSSDGGLLFLASNQSWSIGGQATGTCRVAVGGVNYDGTQSVQPPVKGHTYIQTPNSSGGSFELLPYGSSKLTLVRDENGNWTAVEDSSGGNRDLVQDFHFDTTAQTVEAGVEAEFPLTVENAAGAGVLLDFIPLTISINDKTTNRTEQVIEGDTYYIYRDTYGYFSMEIIGNELCVSTDKLCDPGDYTIQIIVPKDYTVEGKALSKDAVLTVTKGGGGEPDPGPGDPVLNSISVNSTGHKTAYQVGDALDVSGLTIEAAYSDGSKHTVNVTEAMVSGSTPIRRRRARR